MLYTKYIPEVKNFKRFIIEKQVNFPNDKRGLSQLLRDITKAVSIVNREVNKAGFMEILWKASQVNYQRDQPQKADKYAGGRADNGIGWILDLDVAEFTIVYPFYWFQAIVRQAERLMAEPPKCRFQQYKNDK